MPTATSTPSHYAILSLPSPTASTPSPTETQTKRAYRRALLLHHPDKSPKPTSSPTSAPRPTIDQITTAYQTLISPTARSAYDRSLLAVSHYDLQAPTAPYSDRETVVDLDEMHCDPSNLTFYKACRCGSREGKEYVISEAELERHAEEGEVSLQCEGCSLWVRVEFGIVGEGSGGGEETMAEGGRDGGGEG